MIFAAVVGVLSLMATGALHRLLLGILICAGLLIGLANTKLTQLAAMRITSSETPSKQKMALSAASRLVVISTVAIVIGFLLRPNGIGIFFGLAVFQVIQVLHTTLPVLKGLRQQS
ncbi:MAG: hypothetical protein HOQ24_11205 [Mycobacteriaceae bacterium]|nr:hypothetical protein [Mycobacteriaceae bacterium]